MRVNSLEQMEVGGALGWTSGSGVNGSSNWHGGHWLYRMYGEQTDWDQHTDTLPLGCWSPTAWDMVGLVLSEGQILGNLAFLLPPPLCFMDFWSCLKPLLEDHCPWKRHPDIMVYSKSLSFMTSSKICQLRVFASHFKNRAGYNKSPPVVG